MPEACLTSGKSDVFTVIGSGPGPKLQPKARPGPRTVNTPDLHDVRHASGILDLVVWDFRLAAFMSVAYRCLF